ncbi:TetR family transcriptional regulator [Planobispora siamensis]|uniref:TetR family transcriptional regulator n=1 Tax=Planobispora siamensis TaxID=936338 RepID=A0A8J3WP82_9ACTN|nr:TetR family transcriptional regulator [Planobispora siamensis]
MWTREGRPAKNPGLSRDQIVRAAMEILDAEGVDALSMRRLGAKLGSGATSLYWHIAHKDELMELVMDEVYGELSLPDPEVTSWEDMASILAYGLRAAFVKHPWVIPLVGTMPSLGPNAMRMSSQMLKAFERAGFTSPPLDYAVSTLLAFVLGWTGPELAWRATLDSSGMSGRELDAAMMKTVRQAAQGHPDILRRFDEYQAKDPDVVRALAFDFGLTCLLDGLRVRLAECRERARADVPGIAADPDEASRT